MKIIVTIFKAIRKIRLIVVSFIDTPLAKFWFFLNDAEYGRGLNVNGPIKINVTRRGVMKIGNNIRLNSGDNYNIIGRQQRCIFWVEGKLTIGDNVGMSSVAIVCKSKVTIGSNVVIGEIPLFMIVTFIL